MGDPVGEVSQRLGRNKHSLHAGKRKFAKKNAEIRRLKRELARLSEERDIFTSMDWAAFLRARNLEHSMSRRGNCHDDAVAESVFNLLTRERIRRQTYRKREEARLDVFDDIEMFHDPERKHPRNGMLSPTEVDRQQWTRRDGGEETRGHS